jgi:NDP-sugar pyrophosphorylase family protein
MKALILAGGRGKRLNDLTNSVNKCMLTLEGKPVIEYVIERASEISEINEIVAVVGHRAADIINRYGTSYNGTSDTSYNPNRKA